MTCAHSVAQTTHSQTQGQLGLLESCPKGYAMQSAIPAGVIRYAEQLHKQMKHIPVLSLGSMACKVRRQCSQQVVDPWHNTEI